MAFVDAAWIKTCLLEMTIDIAGEHAVAVRHALTPAPEKLEPGVRYGFPVERQPMTVETPRLLQVRLKGRGRGDTVEIDVGGPQRRIGFPESFRTAEVR